MNLLLLDDADFVSADRAVLHDRRLHLHEVHRAENGDTLRVGRLGGWMGEGRLLKLDASEATLEVRFDQPPPAKLPITLLLALPRPKMLRRVLQTIAAMGVPKLVLLNSYRVEKSFWQTPFLDPAAIRENLVLGRSRPAIRCCRKSSSRSASNPSSKTACRPWPPAASAWSAIPVPGRPVRARWRSR